MLIYIYSELPTYPHRSRSPHSAEMDSRLLIEMFMKSSKSLSAQ